MSIVVPSTALPRVTTGRKFNRGIDMNYQEFIKKKQFTAQETGFDPVITCNRLFDYQRDIVTWACRRGKAAIFADTGLGKTLMQITWADQVSKKTGKPVLILAPLAVKEQTIREGIKFGFDMTNIHVNNYDQIHNIDCSIYSGVVLDESSILKGESSKTRAKLGYEFAQTRYKLSCTATPSPNDYMELGTQAEFLDVMSQVEMLAMFFIHDGSDTSKWRLKGHGKKKFFEWLATWAVYISKPSDLGYSDDGHELPELVYHEHIIQSGITDGLFAPIAEGLLERNKARRDTVEVRTNEAANIANGLDCQVLIWCHLNDEGNLLEQKIKDSVQVQGSDSNEHKTNSMNGFTDGKVKKLISKPKISGFGMNWQNCNQIIFVGLSDSWESFYQAVRRCWRYGQTKPVHVHIVSSDIEGGVLLNIKRKEKINNELKGEIVNIMKDKTVSELRKVKVTKKPNKGTVKMEMPSWVA